MLKATEDLLHYLKQKDLRRDWAIISAYVDVISAFGGPDDGKAIGEHLLEHPKDTKGSELYGIIGKWGDKEIAEKFFVSSIENGKLKEGFEPEILEVLGNLKLEAAKPVLVEYALGESDYYSNLHAVRGLLNYSCDDLQEKIRAAIEATFNRSLFNELVPALVGKLQDRKEVLERLFASGSEYCSSDCNGGIFLGFSLCGEEGKPYFKKALLDPAWEAHYPPRFYVVEGMENLGITFAEIYDEIKGIEDIEEQKYGIKVLLSLLEVKIVQKPTRNQRERSIDIQQHFFASASDNSCDTFIDHAGKFGWSSDACRLQDLLRLRLRDEILIRDLSF